MDKLIARLKKDYDWVNFRVSQEFCWRASEQTVDYNPTASGASASWLLLHELAHALLGHLNFSSDFGLLEQEVIAWAKARELAACYELEIGSDYVEDCLDTYRDWLYARSACPRCSNACLQIDNKPIYLCHNCDFSWRVSRERFCRTYRLASNQEPINV